MGVKTTEGALVRRPQVADKLYSSVYVIERKQNLWTVRTPGGGSLTLERKCAQSAEEESEESDKYGGEIYTRRWRN